MFGRKHELDGPWKPDSLQTVGDQSGGKIYGEQRNTRLLLQFHANKITNRNGE